MNSLFYDPLDGEIYKHQLSKNHISITRHTIVSPLNNTNIALHKLNVLLEIINPDLVNYGDALRIPIIKEIVSSIIYGYYWKDEAMNIRNMSSILTTVCAFQCAVCDSDKLNGDLIREITSLVALDIGNLFDLFNLHNYPRICDVDNYINSNDRVYLDIVKVNKIGRGPIILTLALLQLE